MMSSVSIICGLLLFYAHLVLYVNCDEGNQRRQTKKHVALFIFGDSLYDCGNNNYINVTLRFKANRWPYGETFFGFPTGRFCDGRILPDFIATKANLPFLRPYLEPGRHSFSNGVNFASGASGVLPETNPGTISLGMQVNNLRNVTYQLRKELGKDEAKKLLMEAVYLFSTGGNDYQIFFENNYTDLQKYTQLVIGNLTNMIKEIYEMGGRKFAFQNIGPMGCLPLFKQYYGLPINQCLDQLSALAALHNNVFLEAIQELHSQLHGFKYSVFDFYTSLNDVVQNPSKYGFEYADIACCGSGVYDGQYCGIKPYNLCKNTNQFVFFDGAHPGERANLIFIEQFWSGKLPITGPLNLKQLFESASDLSSPTNITLCDDD